MAASGTCRLTGAPGRRGATACLPGCRAAADRAVTAVDVGGWHGGMTAVGVDGGRTAAAVDVGTWG